MLPFTEVTLTKALCLLYFAYGVSCAESPPVMDTSEIHVNSTAGMTAILPCMVHTIRDNQYQIVWVGPRKTPISLGTQLVTTDRRFAVRRPYNSDWNLHITKVRRRDAGMYLCYVNTKPMQQKVVHLNIFVPSKISADTRKTVAEGEQLIVFCNVTGVPPPTVTWFQGNKRLDTGSKDKLEIENINRSQAGLYRCQAFNGVLPKADANITVDVTYPPTVNLLTPKLSQSRGRDVILECSVRWNPAHRIKWLRDGESLPSLSWKYQEEYFSETDHQMTLSLRIMSLEQSDFGPYECMAENDLGQDRATMLLSEIVRHKPSSTSTTEEPPTARTVSSSSTEPVYTYPATTIVTRKSEQSTTTQRVTQTVQYTSPDTNNGRKPNVGSTVNEIVVIPDQDSSENGDSGDKSGLVVVPDNGAITYRPSYFKAVVVVLILRFSVR